MALPLGSWTQCSCGHLHKMKSTSSINISANCIDWSQRVTKDKRGRTWGWAGDVLWDVWGSKTQKVRGVYYQGTLYTLYSCERINKRFSNKQMNLKNFSRIFSSCMSICHVFVEIVLSLHFHLQNLFCFPILSQQLNFQNHFSRHWG